MCNYDIMHEVISLDQVKLSSVNKRLTKARYSKKFILSTEYKIFKTELYYSIKKPKQIIKPPYAIHIYMKTYIDIDNPIKAILDVLQGPVIVKDGDIDRLWIDRLKQKKDSLSELKVYVGTLQYGFVEKGTLPVGDIPLMSITRG